MAKTFEFRPVARFTRSGIRRRMACLDRFNKGFTRLWRDAVDADHMVPMEVGSQMCAAKKLVQRLILGTESQKGAEE